MKDDRLMRMAMLLKAIEDEESDFSSIRTEHKDTLEKLHHELNKLKYEVLTGQNSLPLEIVEIGEAVAAAVNAGALDKDGIKVTAEVRR